MFRFVRVLEFRHSLSRLLVFEFEGIRDRVQGSTCLVRGRDRVQGSGFGIEGSGFKVWVKGSGCGVRGSGFSGFQDSGFRV